MLVFNLQEVSLRFLLFFQVLFLGPTFLLLILFRILIRSTGYWKLKMVSFRETAIFLIFFFFFFIMSNDLLSNRQLDVEIINYPSIIVKLLVDHGMFTINENKSYPTPARVIDYLGFQIYSKAMTLKLPIHKIKSLVRECQKAKQLKILSYENLPR